MSSFTAPFKELKKRLSLDSIYLYRVVTLSLLSISLIVVLYGWFEYKDNVNLAIPLEQKLAIPLMVFGVIAIIAILLFTKPGLSTFLAIAIVAYVVGGEVLSQQITDIFATSSNPYKESSGGIGSSQYESGGLSPPPSSH
ncbi:MAG: hypothetical protein Q9M16_06215 [Mariprofundus sp.]|nr:hypothetical protein [Mariprofundus sp.]